MIKQRQRRSDQVEKEDQHSTRHVNVTVRTVADISGKIFGRAPVLLGPTSRAGRRGRTKSGREVLRRDFQTHFVRWALGCPLIYNKCQRPTYNPFKKTQQGSSRARRSFVSYTSSLSPRLLSNLFSKSG